MQDDAFDHEPDTDIAAPSHVDQALINRIVEGALLASSQPMTVQQLAGLLPEDQPDAEANVQTALTQLSEACADRGVELVEVASGYRYQIKAEVHGWVSRMWTERKTRYTRATLETLALIAYRQPITRGEIEQVRGVAVSSNIIQALEEREWIRVVGHRDVPGRPALFGTTRTFLDYFGLKRLDELPPLSELKDIAELDPQLPLPGAPIPAKADAEGQPAKDADDTTQSEDAPEATVNEQQEPPTPHEEAADFDTEATSQGLAQEQPDISHLNTTINHTDDAPALAEDAPAAATSLEAGGTVESNNSQQPLEDDAKTVSSEQKP